MTTIAENLGEVRARIAAACAAAGREAREVRLLAVSKTFGPEAVREAWAAGQTAFGENYVQEALAKMAALRDLPLEWHCLGPVQSNKTRAVAEQFDWVHSVDRLKTAERLSAQRPEALARAVAALPRLALRGLMCIPEPAPDFEAALAVHRRARELFERLRGEGLALDTLSLGMTADLEAAIHAGSTLVRVGTAIFGRRPAPGPV